MGFLSVGGGGGPRESAPEGAHRAYCHGYYYVGLQRNKWEPDKVRPQVMGVYELEARDSEERRFIVYTRETASFNPKANLRTKVAPVLLPQSFAWSDDEWGKVDCIHLRNETVATPLAGPCMVAMRGNKSGEGTHVGAIAAQPAGQDALVPERDFSEEAPFVVSLVRGEIEGKPQDGLVKYNPEDLEEPQPTKQAEANKQTAQAAQAVADATDGEVHDFGDGADFNPPV